MDNELKKKKKKVSVSYIYICSEKRGYYRLLVWTEKKIHLVLPYLLYFILDKNHDNIFF